MTQFYKGNTVQYANKYKVLITENSPTHKTNFSGVVIENIVDSPFELGHYSRKFDKAAFMPQTNGTNFSKGTILRSTRFPNKLVMVIETACMSGSTFKGVVIESSKESEIGDICSTLPKNAYIRERDINHE